MATYADLQAVVDALRSAHPGWSPPAEVEFALNTPPLGPFVPNSLFDTLRGAAPPGFFNANGQLASQAPHSPAPILPRPSTPDLVPPTNIPGPPTGVPVERDLTVPHNRLDSVTHQPGNKNQKSVPHDPTLQFIDAYNAIIGATGSGPGNNGWNATIEGVKSVLQDALMGLNNGLKGMFADALRSNLSRSFEVLHDMSEHARKMEILFESFFDDLATTKSNFEKYAPSYNQAIEHPNDPTSKETLNQLNGLVVDIMNVYRGPIDDIAASHPSINSAVPDVGTPLSGPIGPGGRIPGGSGGPEPEMLPRGGLNTGETPPNPQAAQPESGGAQSPPSAPTDGLGGAGDGADQAQKAGGQAGDAAPIGLGDKSDAKGTAGRPEGLLGLGPKGLSGMSRTGGGVGGRGGGGGGGRGLVGAKPTANVTAAPKLGNSPAPVSRAGVSGAGGQGAAGAPVAGHQGSGADKTHKANKALRLPKNGEEVVGETEAVTPVIGQVPKKAAPADPSKT